MTRTEALENVAWLAQDVYRAFERSRDVDGMLVTCRALGHALADLDRSTDDDGPMCECGDPLSRHFKTTSGETACGGDGIGCGCRLFRPVPRPSSPASPPLPVVAHPACPDGTAFLVGTVAGEDGGTKRIEAVRLTGLASPASPECRHRNQESAMDESAPVVCSDCGAVWLDDGQGWRPKDHSGLGAEGGGRGR